MHDSRTAAPASPAWSPIAGTVVAGCAFVATAAWLGAEWPRAEVAGAPLGLWAIVAAAGSTAYLQMRPGDGGASFSGVMHGLDSLGGGLAPGAHRWLRTAWRTLGGSTERWERLEEQVTDRLDRAQRPSHPLSVGACLPSDLGGPLAGTIGAMPVVWSDLEAHARAPGVHDALLRVEHGTLRIDTPEAEGLDAAWYDWSIPRPLSYTSVFPLRIDPARVSLGNAEDVTPADAGLLRAIADAAAAMSRNPSRLTLEDRLRGRRPQPASERAFGRSWVDAAMMHLALEGMKSGAPGLRAPALRAASAWLSTCEHADAQLRAEVAEAAVNTLTTEPEPLLRLAAARFALLDDEGALGAMLRADTLIRARSPEPIVDHLAFLQSEVELGLPTPTTLGRVAAGICLVCACAPAERLAYIRDDILDDLRYSGWLVGRDQDRAVLLEVFRVLEKARQKPARAAA